jgi:Tfp pilus assembly PilM family ATPase
MLGNILSIELGKTSVRMAVVRQGLRQFQVTHLFRISGADLSDLTKTAREVKDALDSENLRIDYIVIGISGTLCFLRYLYFPFAQKEKIRQAVEFEIEPTLPVDIHELAISFEKTGHVKADLHGVLAGAVSRGLMDNILAAFAEVGLDPDEVVPGVTAYSGIFDIFPLSPQEDCLLVDPGESDTSIIFFKQGRPVYFRCAGPILGGISDKNSKNPDHVSNTDIENDKEIQAPGLREHDLVKQKWLQKLTRELEMVLIASGESGADAPVKIFMAGYKKLTSREKDTLETIFESSIVRFSSIIPTENFIDESLSAQSDSYAAVICQALKVSTTGSGLNFRSGSYSKTTFYTKWKKPLIHLAAGFALIMVAWISTLGFQIYLAEKKHSRTQELVHEVFYRTLPDVTGSFSPSQYPSIIQTRINALRGGDASLPAWDDQVRFVEAARIFSRLLAENPAISFNHVVYDSSRIMINGVADAYNTVEEARNILSGADEFRSVSIRGARSSAQGNSINFSLEIELA